MFERFTHGARETVIMAQEEARRLGHRHVGSEHILLGVLCGENADPARATLAELGLTHESAEAQLSRIAGGDDLDANALKSVGIDLDEVRRRVEAQFGPGALDECAPDRRSRWLRRNSSIRGGWIPFTGDAKDTLELALREALALKHREIGSAHILLGLLRCSSGLGFRIIQSQGLEPGLVRTRVTARLRTSA